MASAMVERGRGGLIFLSSLAGLQGTAMTAHYAASKAYLRVLAEGLWDELRPRGVDVLAVLAGPTATPGYLGSKPNDRTIGSLRFPPIAEPRAVVRASLASLGERPVCIPGALNTAIAFAMQRLVPTRVAVGTVSRATRRLYRR
jgi:hypothetical protein